MQRTDIEATDPELKELLKEDSIRRNTDLAEMVRMLWDTKGPYTLFLDGDWGSGKTIFVKQLRLILEVLNAQIGSHSLSLEELKQIDDFGSLVEAAQSRQGLAIRPYYFNAWKNDFFDDPLPGFFQSMSWEMGGARDISFKDLDNLISMSVEASFDPAIPLSLGISFKPEKILMKNSLLKKYRLRMKMRDEVKKLFSVNRQNELTLIIIDELDRCRPTYAIRLLEEVKHLFEGSEAVVIFSVNLDQLIEAVKGCYGESFDAGRYMTRFYDRRYRLPFVDKMAYRQYLIDQSNVDTNAGRPSPFKAINQCKDIDIVSEAIDQIGRLTVSLRDQNRLYDEIAELSAFVQQESIGEGVTPVWFLLSCLAPILFALKTVRPQDYQSIVEKSDSDCLSRYIMESDWALESVGLVFGEDFSGSSEASIAWAKTSCPYVIKDVLTLMFPDRVSPDEYSDARARRLAHQPADVAEMFNVVARKITR